MTQMVLPQTPAPGMQNDAGAVKTRPGNDKGTSEKRYESVSRAEQKRLDNKQARRGDEGKHTDKNDNTSKTDSGNRQSETSVNQAGATRKPGDPGKDADLSLTEAAILNGLDANNADTAAEMESAATPLSFAELQALVLPATGQATATGTLASTPGSPAIAPDVELFPGLTDGKPGQTGLQLTDSLIQIAGKKAGNLDPSALLTGTRFESAMELVSQQTTGHTLGKLAAEAQVPLRGYATSVDVPVNHAEWGDKLMGKLSWLTAKNLSVAEIHLTPPDMGPMEVRVRVQNEQANITVHAANPVVREQLELHSHRLRDMLGEQGLSLAQFDVSDNARDSSGEQSAGEGEGSPAGSGRGVATADTGEDRLQTGSLDLSWQGAIDVFA